MKKILVIDNYDSFVYNLVHYLEELDCEVTVKRNDQLQLADVEEYDKILLSPGPGIPDEDISIFVVPDSDGAVVSRLANHLCPRRR